MAMSFGEDLRKVVLLGIGATAMTVEKSKELIDDLVKKGELTVEQGKELNKELKHNIKDTLDKRAPEAGAVVDSLDSIIGRIENMTKEEINELKEKLANMEANNADGEEKNTEE